MTLRSNNEYPATAWWHEALDDASCPPEVQALADMYAGETVPVTRERAHEIWSWAERLCGWSTRDGERTALVVEEDAS